MYDVRVRGVGCSGLIFRLGGVNEVCKVSRRGCTTNPANAGKAPMVLRESARQRPGHGA